MNILYITNHLNIGGITTYVLSLATGLKKRGHTIYVASSGGELLPEFLDRGINFIPISIRTKSEISPKILISLLKLRKFIKERDIDIIHSHTRVTGVLGCLIQHYFHKVHISTCHGFFKKRLSRIVFSCWGEKVVAISESTKEHLIRDFKVKEEDIRVIHNGIDVDRFREQRTENREQRKKDLGLGEGPVIGIIARLSEEKGHSYLIEAIKEVISKIPQAQLLIVGAGRMKVGLVNLTKTLSLENNVFFLPSVKDTQELLSIMDVFVMPSLKEGLGLSLMEAEACGLGVIGTDVGGIKSLIQHGYNGLLVKPKDVRQLSQAILELLMDEEKRRYLGENARDFILKNFSLEKMVQETEEVYLECLAAKD